MRILFAFVIICLSLLVKAQNVPQYINYQTLIRNVDGTYIANKSVSLRLSIVRDAPAGLPIYQEVHDSETNDYGLVNLKIGDGMSSNDFSAIDWGDGPYYIQTEMSVYGGVYEEIGVSPFSSVPYALYAQSSGTPLQEGVGVAIQDNTISARHDEALWNTQKIQNVDVSPASPNVGDVLVFDGQKWIPGQAPNAKVPAGTSVISTNPESPEGYGFTGNTLSTTKTVGEWTLMTSMNYPRRHAAVAACNGQVFVFGGEDNNIFQTRYVEAYNPINNTWSILNEMPVGSTQASAVESGGMIYISGGLREGSNLGSDRVDVYDPVAHTWSSIASMKEGRWNHSLLEIKGKLYAVGGLRSLSGDDRIATIEEYNFDTNSWAVIADIPIPLAQSRAVYCNGEIFVVAGAEERANSYTVSNRVIAYNLETQQWSEKGSINESRIAFAIDVVDNQIVVAGGINKGVKMNSAELFSPETDTWLHINNISELKNGSMACVVNESMYVIGGQRKQNAINIKLGTVEKLNVQQITEKMYIYVAQ